jgi:hypothetical protein
MTEYTPTHVPEGAQYSSDSLKAAYEYATQNSFDTFVIYLGNTIIGFPSEESIQQMQEFLNNHEPRNIELVPQSLPDSDYWRSFSYGDEEPSIFLESHQLDQVLEFGRLLKGTTYPITESFDEIWYYVI